MFITCSLTTFRSTFTFKVCHYAINYSVSILYISLILCLMFSAPPAITVQSQNSNSFQFHDISVTVNSKVMSGTGTGDGDGDGLDRLRVPYDKIKFGKKLESQGYGTVFQGKFGDQRVALKQLNITNFDNIRPQLLAEILTISRFGQHPNLVALLGFCDEKHNKIILVYKYVASGNLGGTIMDRLTMIQRLELCLGAARGLCYLHTGVESTPIVHGNIKLSKILLNSDANSSKFEAKVSSFGLSKIMPGKSHKTLESSYGVREKPTKESDVYSFGVVLLEVLCGASKLPDMDDACEIYPVSELVPNKMKQNKLLETVHINIRKEIRTEALDTYAAIACQCVMENPDARPQMAQVVEELEKALRLQGGEVTYVQIPGPRNILTIGEGGGEANDKVEKNTGKTTDMIAPYWSRVWSPKKATEDWITKDGVIATAIGLMVGGIAVALILIGDR